MTSVGVIANPASGRDVRRLTSGASVFDNAEKASMVLRLMHGLAASGIDEVVMMPTAPSVAGVLRRQLATRQPPGSAPLPALRFLDQPVTETARDSERAVAALVAEGVAAIVGLGGDGTQRLIARGCGEIPLCPLSTGTNNAFPEMREATVAGLAVGLVASGRAGTDGLRREAALHVRVERAAGDRDPVEDLALVDLAVTGQRFVGARAVSRADDLRELLVTHASPSAIGLSSVAAALDPVRRGGRQGLHVRLAPVAAAPRRVVVPLAPGVVVPVGVRDHRRIALGEAVELEPADGSIALDGEREIELRRDDRALVRLVAGPRTVDVDAVLRAAAHEPRRALATA